MKENKNACNSVGSRLLGDKIRNEEAIRSRAVVLLSSEPRPADERKSKIILLTYCDSKEKYETGRSLGGDYFYTKQDFLAIFFF